MADEKDPRFDSSEHPDDETSTEHDVDPETRMLDQIAALDAADDDATAASDQDDEVAAQDVEAQHDDVEDHQATEVIDQEDVGSSNAPRDTVEHTSVMHPVPPVSDDPQTARDAQRKKKRRWPWVVTAVVLLLGGGYVAAAFATQNTLPATLTVEGVDVSGMSIEEATPVLEEEFAARAERQITVTVEENDGTIVPADAGYTYDVDATLQRLTELTFDPVALWQRLFGEAAVEAEKSVDEDTSSEAIAGLAEQLTFDPTEGAVGFVEASVDYTPPVNGFTVDQEELAEQLDDQWLSETTDLPAPGEVTDPAVSAEQWEQFVADTAEPLVADVYSVTAGDTTADLTPAQLADAAEVRIEAVSEETADEASSPSGDAAQQTSATEPAEAETSESAPQEGDHPVLLLDGEALAEGLADNNADFASTNQDASIQLSGSAGSARPEVIPGSTGRGVDGEQIVDEILADLNGEQTRAITVELHEVEPNVTTEEAEAWDVNHVVAEYATPYPPHVGPRTANLRVGADRVNGTVVMPGEEFNLNSLLAPVTLSNGYHSSGVVESGVTSNAVGGGLSQIATMSYNAGFLGGMEIVEHKPHSRWFERYPQGRESTYWEGQINVRWHNDTDAPVIVEMWLAGNQVHTRLWGSDYYNVSTSTSEPYNYTAAPTIRNNDAECIPETGGRQGFTVDVHRTKTPPGGQAVQESWSWAYSGWPTVICE